MEMLLVIGWIVFMFFVIAFNCSTHENYTNKNDDSESSCFYDSDDDNQVIF